MYRVHCSNYECKAFYKISNYFITVDNSSEDILHHTRKSIMKSYTKTLISIIVAIVPNQIQFNFLMRKYSAILMKVAV